MGGTSGSGGGGGVTNAASQTDRGARSMQPAVRRAARQHSELTRNQREQPDGCEELAGSHHELHHPGVINHAAAARFVSWT